MFGRPLGLALLVALAPVAAAVAQDVPRHYVCYRAPSAPRLDGSLDDPAWSAAPWSDAFVDIEGDRKPLPRFRTRMKMLWDDRYLYVAAELEEPQVWATITRRDAVIFHDNDFEMFIDPDGDAKQYAELEINALNTVWDLFLEKPYREGGHADDAWDVVGLKTGVEIHGTINQPADSDSGWTVTLALPWASLERASHTRSAPQPGQSWRINYSRVEWRTTVENGTYVKVPSLREDNWVWTPQGMVDMHQPEHWGYVEFSPLRADRRPATLPEEIPRPPLVLSGYLADVSGAILAYHSPHPEAETALLARARRDVQSVSWLTDTVPASLEADTVQFVWIAGLAGSKGVHDFDFAINGRHAFTFSSIRDSAARNWSVAGADGSRLSFRTTLVDQFQDVFGYLTLTLPRSAVAPGAPLTLAVTGQDAESSDWYMTFRHRLAAHPRVAQDPVLVKAGDSVEAQIRVILDNLAGARAVRVEVAGHAPVDTALQFGANVVRALAGAVAPDGRRTANDTSDAPSARSGPAASGTAARDVRVVVRLDGALALDTLLPLMPVPRRDVYLLSYSHNDIGYSDLQPRVERKQWQNIEDAMRLIERTRGYPPEARYRWNVEQLWPVESWLAQAPDSSRQRFLADVREGSIALNGFLGGVLSGLATAPEMTHFFEYARRLRDSLDLPITTALISDIPGQSWGIVTALAESRLRWFAMAPNNGDRIGYVLQDWGDRPFYWVSQSRQDTVLAWVAGASYSQFHEARIRVAGERKLFSLMRRLEAMAYPYTPVQLPYTVDGDNGPTDPDLPDYVVEWNRRYASPRLLIATHAEMFRALEAGYAKQLPVVSGDFTGYWEDGAASTARETALARAASSRLVQADALCAMLPSAACSAADDYAAWRDVVLWDEHTWGAAASVETPEAPDVVSQWRYKQAFALGADSLSRLLVENALAGRGRAVTGAFDVFNTSSWPRTGLVVVPAELSRAGDRVIGPDSHAVPSQRLSSGELAVLVRDVPALGARRYRVRAGPPALGGGARAGGLVVENALIRAVVDSTSGAVRSLVWKLRGAELVDSAAQRGLDAYVYVPGRDSSLAAGPSRVRVRVGERGPLVASLVVEAEAPGARSVTREVRVVAGLDGVQLVTTIDKAPVRSKEGAHLAFPFRVPDGRMRYDVASGVVRPDSDQLRGAAKNFVEVQSWVDVSNDSAGVTVTTPDAPLVEVGGINAESPWMRTLPRTQTFYAYVMNNYWHTNYKAEQEGPVTFRNWIRPHGRFAPDAAVRFGAEARSPLLVVAAAGGAPPATLVTVTPAAVVVTALREGASAHSWLVQLYNPTPEPQRVLLQWRGSTRVLLRRSDSSGRRGARIPGTFPLPPYGTAVVLAEQAGGRAAQGAAAAH